jgi:hypothetical protein
MNLRDLHNLYRLKPESVPEKNAFFTGAVIGGAISLIIWIALFKAIF